jgi:hypothetical protein
MNIAKQIAKTIAAQALGQADAADQVRGRVIAARVYLASRAQR